MKKSFWEFAEGLANVSKCRPGNIFQKRKSSILSNLPINDEMSSRVHDQIRQIRSSIKIHVLFEHFIRSPKEVLPRIFALALCKLHLQIQGDAAQMIFKSRR